VELVVTNMPFKLELLCGVEGGQLAFQFRKSLWGWWLPIGFSI
jgi:hypothetical protein